MGTIIEVAAEAMILAWYSDRWESSQQQRISGLTMILSVLSDLAGNLPSLGVLHTTLRDSGRITVAGLGFVRLMKGLPPRNCALKTPALWSSC